MTSRRSRWTGVWLAAWVSSTALACAPRDNTPRGRGARIFQRSCSGCHGPDGKGVARLGLVKPPRDLTRAEFHAQVTDEQLRQVIRVGKGQMPAFGGLMDDSDVRDVITFIRTLPPQPAAPAATAAQGSGGVGAGGAPVNVGARAEEVGGAPR